MRLEARKLLFDVQRAAELLAEFITGKQFADYQGEPMLRASVEREFEIIGEALSRLARLDAELVARISDHRRIIGFRNILIHGYADVDDRVVWDIVQADLPRLRQEVEVLLGEKD